MSRTISKPITAWFVGGPWHLETRLVDSDRHYWITPKSQGLVEYRRITKPVGSHLIILFIETELALEEKQAKVAEVVAVAMATGEPTP